MAHFQAEWQASGVKNSIIGLNVTECTGREAFEKLYRDTIRQKDRRQSGGNPFNAYWMKKFYKMSKVDGWAVTGIDPLNGFVRNLKNIRFKPTEGNLAGLRNPKTGKIPKYFSPAKPEGSLSIVSHVRPIFLEIGDEEWNQIAENKNIKRTELDRIFWKWAIETNCPITITEGEKKAGCLLSHGIAGVSIPGIYCGTHKVGKTHQLLPALALFDTPGRQVGILFDYEPDRAKRRKLRRAALRLAFAFKHATVKIAFVPGPEKGIDDYIMAGKSGKNIIFRSAFDVKSEQDWRLFDVDLTVNQQYLDIVIPPDRKLVFIKSSKGTGKTTVLDHYIAAMQAQNKHALIISHRVTLGKALAEKFGIPWIDEIKDFYKDEFGRAVRGNFLGNGLCYDSLHSNGQGRAVLDNSRKIIILDEAEQGITHVLSSSTCQKYRVEILENLRLQLQNAHQIICCDADLTDTTIKFIEELAGVKGYVIENTHKPFQWQVTINGDTDAASTVQQIEEAVSKGERAWICTDSQKANSKYGSLNLEKLLKKKFPDKKFLRIDQSTTADPKHPAFGCASHINEIVASGEYDGYIVSPTLVSGVSVDVRGCIDKVFGIFQGVGMPTDCMQALARVREPVDRIVWLRTRGVGMVAGGEFNPTQICRRMDKVSAANFGLLSQADAIGATSNSSTTWANYVARNNYAFSKYREWVKSALENDGHIVTIVESEQDDESKKELKEMKEYIGNVRDESVTEEADLVVNAADIDDKKFEELSKKSSKTIHQQREEKKHRIKKTYGVSPTDSLVKLTDVTGWHGSLMMHYYTTVGRCFLEKRDKQHLKSHVERGKGTVVLHDLNLLTAKVRVLEALNLAQFEVEGKVFAKGDEQVTAFVEMCRRNRDNIRDVLGVTFTDEDAELRPMRLIQRFLNIVGKKLTSGTQQRVKGDKKARIVPYWYEGKLSHADDSRQLRESIFEAWATRDSLMVESEMMAA